MRRLDNSIEVKLEVIAKHSSLARAGMRTTLEFA
jgi:hypothetical protein